MSRWAVCACETGILGSYSAFHIKLKKGVPSSYSTSRCYTRAVDFRVRRSGRYSPGDGGNCQKFHSQQNWRHGGNRLCRNAPQYVVAALIHGCLIGEKVHQMSLTYMSLQEVMQKTLSNSADCDQRDQSYLSKLISHNSEMRKLQMMQTSRLLPWLRRQGSRWWLKHPA